MTIAIETKNRIFCELTRVRDEVHRGVVSLKSRGMNASTSQGGAIPVSAAVEAPRSSAPPPNDVLAGAAARAAAQSTIHPIDTIKVSHDEHNRVVKRKTTA